MIKRVDVAILGAGLSGLTLARALAQAGRRLRVLVLEPRTVRLPNRHLMFPARPDHPLSRYEQARFAGFDVHSPRGARLHRPLRALVLSHVAVADILSDALEAVEAAPRVGLEDGVRIDQIRAGRTGMGLTTSLGEVRASWVVDTRPAKDPGMPTGAAVQSTQILAAPLSHVAQDTDAPCLRLGLSDSPLVSLQQSVRTRTGVRVEQVSFTIAPTRPSDVDLHDALEALGGDLEQHRRASAIWPITQQRQAQTHGRLIHAPADADGLRFAPGMAALRLSHWAQDQARRLTYGFSMTAPKGPSWPARISAHRIAASLAGDPDQARQALQALLYDASPDGVMRTLSGVPNALDVLQAIGERRW